MDRIVIKDFRCFHEEQTARLAPLTLLVGENSTGKTSFMAMIRALWDVAYGHRVPDFKEDPYDLGSFDEIAHHRGAKGGRADTFKAGFYSSHKHTRIHDNTTDKSHFDHFSATFGRSGTVPVPMRRSFTYNKLWVEEHLDDKEIRKFGIGTERGAWMYSYESKSAHFNFHQKYELGSFYLSLRFRKSVGSQGLEDRFVPLSGSPDIAEEDLDQIDQLTLDIEITGSSSRKSRPYASAPVRSKPRRTYDPARSVSDPEGDHVPMYLANVYVQDKRGWTRLKGALESFGKNSGLFDEITIKQLGKRESQPFQVEVRKFGAKSKGPRRNLIDVGYGVSQVLPVITELLRQDAPPMFLLQQPEVHLHPSAQAALGSVFCELAKRDFQLVVETHSDHLLDRVRMDVRDGRGRLEPDDVSILFFERNDLDVRIHSLRLDEKGNIIDAPKSYRKFFMEETQRSLGI